MNLSEILDSPIAFQRAFVSIGAGITGALMLSQALYWSRRTDDAEGWFYKTMEEWESETGMTRSEQEGARKKLVKAGVLEEKKKGVPCRLFFRVNLDAIAANLGAENTQASLQKTRNPVCGKPANKDAENPQPSTQKTCKQARRKPANLTENTTETTAEITAENLARPCPAEPAKAGQPANVIPLERPKRQRRNPKDDEARQEACREIWNSYSAAYLDRYKTKPIRNAKVNSQVNDLLKRLGAEAAAVAGYFVSINDSWLIRNCHEFGSLLAKAEAYRTQWVTGSQMNATTARQLEQTQANVNAAQQAAERIRDKGGKRNAFL